MKSDSPYSGSQNLSVAGAANRLQDALKSLEGVLIPMADRLKKLEVGSQDSEVLEADRARLARELDAAQAANASHKTQAEEWAQKEKEFAQLANETMGELDAVITQVQQALGQGGS